MLKKNLRILLVTVLMLILATTTVLATSQVTEENNTTNTDYSVEAISEEGDENTTTEEETTTSDDYYSEVDTSSWVNSDLFKCSDNIYINTIVDGNVYLMGKTVELGSEVAGSVYILADEVIINTDAVVYGSIFVCANKLTYEGACYDVYGVVQSCTLTENAYIDRDLKIVGNTVELNGLVVRNADITAESIKFNTTETENETVSTVIIGNLNYTTNSEMDIPEGTVTGEITFNQLEETESKTGTALALEYISNFASAMIYALVIALFIIFIAPKFAKKASDLNVSKGFMTLGVGILGVIVGICIPLFLFFTVVGVKTAFVILGIFALLCTISVPVVYVIIAKILAKKFKWEGKGKLLLTTLLVAAIVWIISLIPIVGFIVKVILGIYGLGAIVVSLKPAKEAKQEKEVEKIEE